ncbi:MAG: hypothetical protein ACHP65_06075 [Legionellales bacterium]
MLISEMVKLYGRNFKSTFLRGYTEAGNMPVAAGTLAFFLHTILLPVTLLFGPAIKTMIDISTREPVAIENINAFKQDLEALNEQQFDDVIVRLLTYLGKVKSKSSQQLLC